jgi:tight adherence protein C
MLLVCGAVGLALFLFLLPACLGVPRTNMSSLQGRIDVEREELINRAFHTKPSRLKVVGRLEKNETLQTMLCRWTGTDMAGTERILSRIHWNVTLPEVLLAKATGGVLLLGSIGYLVVRLYSGQEISSVTLAVSLFALAVFLFPTLLLEWADKRVKGEIREQVPIFFSIVQALVEAGMPIQAAVKNTARRFDARLGWELARLEVEEKRCGNWRKALEEMAYRWEVDALISIALEINEAVSKGVSVGGILAAQVEEQLRQQEDEASAYMNRLSIRLLPFVILLMGVPLLFLVMGPAFMSMKMQL